MLRLRQLPPGHHRVGWKVYSNEQPQALLTWRACGWNRRRSVFAAGLTDRGLHRNRQAFTGEQPGVTFTFNLPVQQLPAARQARRRRVCQRNKKWMCHRSRTSGQRTPKTFVRNRLVVIYRRIIRRVGPVEDLAKPGLKLSRPKKCRWAVFAGLSDQNDQRHDL